MAEFSVTRPLLESVRDNKQSWLVVQGGLKCAQVGMLCAAAGFAITILLTLAASSYTSPGAAALVALVGGVTCAVGMVLVGIGLVQCLLVPHAPSRTLLLAGFLLGIYATHISTYDLFRVLQSGSSDAAEWIRKEMQSSQMRTIVLTSGANLLVVGALLSLAAFLGSKDGVKRVQALWKLQFGGGALFVALSFSMGAISVWLDLQFIVPVLLLVLTALFVAGVLWFQATVLIQLRTDLGRVIGYHDRKLADVRAKQQAVEA